MAHILVIDDDASVRRSVRRTLETAGHRVSEAPEGAAGEAILETDPAELVITDIFMPGQEGLETVRSLRGAHPDLAIIAISGGWGSLEPSAMLTMARKLGADRILAKPFEVETLLTEVETLLDEG